MLKQILLIYRDDFVVRLAKKLLEQSNIQCYGFSRVDENFAYLIDDLAPEVVLIDEKVYRESRDLIDESLGQAKAGFAKALMAESAGQEPFAESFDYTIHLPLEVANFAEQLRSLVEKKPH